MASVRAIPGWAALAALVILSTLLRWWAASRVPNPWIVPDEVVYGELGRSLYVSGSFEILGEPVRFYSLLYPALAGLPLSLSDVQLGYDLLKPLQALVMSLTAVPVYLWGRSLMARGWALAAAALTLAIPGLAYSGLIMTEVAFYPIAALAAWAIAAALARPSLLNQALAAAAILAAAATRLQAAVLGPVVVTALVLLALFERSPRRAVRLWPLVAALALAGAGWAAWRLEGGGPASEVFGAYRAAGEVHYSVSDTVLYTRWHAADVLLMTGVIPACALAILLVSALAGRERSREARSYLAVAASLTAWLTVEVAVFASRHVGRLAERDLLAVAPVLFLGFALWLDRGAPRPRVTTALVGAAALGLVLALPVGRLVSHAAIPDAFTIIPLQRLQDRRPDVDLQLLVDLLAAVAVLAFAVVPRRWRVALPVAVGLVFATVSIHVSRVVAAEATIVGRAALGDDRRWIDKAANGPVTYVYSGEALFTTVWESIFWNRKVVDVYRLRRTRVPGLNDDQQPPVAPRDDGSLVLADGSRAEARYALASAVLGFAGKQLDYAFAPALVLWKVDPPLRLSTEVQQTNARGLVARDRVLVYACRGGMLRFRLSSPEEQYVALFRNGRLDRAIELETGKSRFVTMRAVARPPLGGRLCRFDIRPETPLAIDQIRFTRR